MNWLVVLDPIDGLKPKTDSSLAIITEARRQGITVDTATLDKLFFTEHAGVEARDSKDHLRLRKLLDYQLILMRKEPPYDLAFHYATQLLSLADNLVVNNPGALRDYNEKLIALNFRKFMPPTLVSSEPDRIAEFCRQMGTCVIKSLESFQGKSVKKLDHDTDPAIQSYTENGRQPVMVQKFLDDVFTGDKRVILVGEKLLGAVLRKPKTGFHANFANSQAIDTVLTHQEQEAVAEIGPWLVERGIHFSGLDFIGGHLTEINITCPTGIVQMSEFANRNLAVEVVDYLRTLSEQQ